MTEVAILILGEKGCQRRAGRRKALVKHSECGSMTAGGQKSSAHLKKEKVECGVRSPGAGTHKDASIQEGFSVSNLHRALKRQKELACSVQPWGGELGAMWGVTENQVSVKELSNRAVH